MTSFGREGIDTCIDATREFDPEFVVVYGDTDSVMVNVCISRDYPDFETMPREEVLRITIERAVKLNDFINARFKRPINLEFEKILWPYLLISKKRYAAMHYEYAADPGFLNVKGMEATRRDNALLTAATVKRVLELLLNERDPDGAVAHARGVIERLVKGEVPNEELVISKSYGRDDYVGKQPHVELIKRMQARGVDEYRVSLGDRVPYVIVTDDRPVGSGLMAACPKGAAPKDLGIASNRAEDPEYAAKHKMPIDALYYIQQQLLKPLIRILKPLLGSEEEVIRRLCGVLKRTRAPQRGIDHTRFLPAVRAALYGSGASSMGLGKHGRSKKPSEERDDSAQKPSMKDTWLRQTTTASAPSEDPIE